MGDMHGNSLKTLRQNLLSQRQEFIKKDDFIQIELKLLTNLNRFLADKKESISSVALYCPIQGEIDLRPTLLEWAKSKPKRCLALPFARPDKHLEFYQWQSNDPLIQGKSSRVRAMFFPGKSRLSSIATARPIVIEKTETINV